MRKKKYGLKIPQIMGKSTYKTFYWDSNKDRQKYLNVCKRSGCKVSRWTKVERMFGKK
jgi:hypothetical protein